MERCISGGSYQVFAEILQQVIEWFLCVFQSGNASLGIPGQVGVFFHLRNPTPRTLCRKPRRNWMGRSLGAWLPRDPLWHIGYTGCYMFWYQRTSEIADILRISNKAGYVDGITTGWNVPIVRSDKRGRDKITDW